MMVGSVHDWWLGPRLPALASRAGVAMAVFHCQSFALTADAGYMLTVIDAGADLLEADGRIGEELSAALKSKALVAWCLAHSSGLIAYAGCQAARPSRRGDR